MAEMEPKASGSLKLSVSIRLIGKECDKNSQRWSIDMGMRGQIESGLKDDHKIMYNLLLKWFVPRIQVCQFQWSTLLVY